MTDNSSEVDSALQIIQDAMSESELFAGMDAALCAAIVGCMKPHDFEVGQEIVAEGAISKTYYIVETGVFEVLGTDDVYVEGESFGEIALAYDMEAMEAIRCAEAGRLWGLDRDDFRRLLTRARKARIAPAVRFLEGVGVPAAVADEQMSTLSEALVEVRYSDGARIWSKGDVADHVLFILSGKIVASTTDNRQRVPLQAGDFFGTQALAPATDGAAPVRMVDGTARGEVVAMQLARASLSTLLFDGCEASVTDHGVEEVGP